MARTILIKTYQNIFFDIKSDLNISGIDKYVRNVKFRIYKDGQNEYLKLQCQSAGWNSVWKIWYELAKVENPFAINHFVITIIIN